MKKLYTIIAMAFALTTVCAQAPISLGSLSAPRTTPSGQSASLVASGSPLYKSANAPARIETALPDVSQIISKQPAGTLYADMLRDCKGFNDGYEKTFVAYAGDIVISSDKKKVYIKNFCPVMNTGWIVGDMDESGLVTFTFPQVVYHQSQDATGATYELTEYAWKTLIDRENLKITPDPNSQTVQFKWDGTTLTQVNADDVIALADGSGKFGGYGSYANTFSVVKDETVQPSAALTQKSYTMTYVDYVSQQPTTKAVKVAIDGNDVYLGHFYNDCWIKGTISGNKVTFPAYQYLGTETILNKVHEYMVAFEISADRQEAKLIDNLVLDYDPVAGTMGTTTQSFGVNQGKKTAGLIDVYELPTFSDNKYEEGTPAKPEILTVMPYGANEEGLAAVAYANSNLSTDGKPLDKEKLFYNIYLDGKLLTFNTSAYGYIPTNMTDIPYAYYDVNITQSQSGAKGYDFQVLDDVQVVFLYKDFTVLGLKAVYVDGDTRLESEMAEYDIRNAAGISSATADEADASTVTYYDLSGRKVSTPSKGVYVRSVKLKSGAVKTTKVVVR